MILSLTEDLVVEAATLAGRKGFTISFVRGRGALVLEQSCAEPAELLVKIQVHAAAVTLLRRVERCLSIHMRPQA